jgi:hypothetical protein
MDSVNADIYIQKALHKNVEKENVTTKTHETARNKKLLFSVDSCKFVVIFLLIAIFGQSPFKVTKL